MSTVAKVLIVLNLVLAAAFLASAAAFLGYQDHWSKKYEVREAYWKGELASRDAQIKQINEEKANLSRQNNEAQSRAAASEAQAQKDRATADMLREHDKQVSASLTALTRANEAMQQTLSANQTQITQLQEARQKLTEAVTVANDAKDAAVRNANSLQVASDSVSKEKEALMARVDELQKALDRANFQLQSVQRGGGGEVPTEAPPPDAGQVLAVDQAANVVIISLGAEDKLKPGFRYIVSRGDDYVGTIQITNVEAKKSSARSLKDLQKSPIQVGDKVIPK